MWLDILFYGIPIILISIVVFSVVCALYVKRANPVEIEKTKKQIDNSPIMSNMVYKSSVARGLLNIKPEFEQEKDNVTTTVIERETIVKIKCSYCKTLNLETNVKCSNCGATL